MQSSSSSFSLVHKNNSTNNDKSNDKLSRSFKKNKNLKTELKLETSEKIKQVATKLFAEKGIDSVSVREIALAAQVNLSLISYHFDGKVGLYRQIILDFANTASKRFEVIFEKSNTRKMTLKSFKQDMHFLIQEMLHMKFANPFLFIMLEREALNGLPYAKDIYENVFDSLARKIVGVFKVAQKNGFIKKDINLYVHFMFMVHSTDFYFAALRCNTSLMDELYQLPKQIEKLIQQTYQLYIEGILA